MDINNIVFLDVETTGLNPLEDGIMQIALVKGDQSLTTLLKPDSKVTPDAYEVHGISDEMVANAPTFAEAMDSMIPFLDPEQSKIICGYNISFDFKFIQSEFARNSIMIESRNYELIDPLEIHRKLNPRDLSSLYKKYTGKELANSHDALVDTLACREIFEIQSKGDHDFIELSGLKDVTIEKWFKKSEDHYVFNKGKHLDKTIEEVAHSDPDYLLWVQSLNTFSVEEDEILKEYQ